MDIISIIGKAVGGRPKALKTCPGCGREMGTREFHDHAVSACLENAKFDRVWASVEFATRCLDPRYYDHDERSGTPSTLMIVGHVNMSCAAA